MKKRMFLLFIALFAGITAAGVKYVAVIETEIDAQSGAAAEMTPAEVRLVTAELRREAVNNLPQGAYNVMTSETVYAQGGAVLEDCADENCVITLGSKIGADYIVRGTISKMRTRFTLTVEMYETENGNLVALSDPVRSESVDGLIEMAAETCANMYKKFANTNNSPQKPPVNNTPTANAKPAKESVSKPAPEQPAKEKKERRPMTGGTLGFGGFPKDEYWMQLGVVHSRPLSEKTVSLNMEGNIWTGYYEDESEKNSEFFFGFNLPLTALFQVSFFSFEAGAHGDVLFGKEGTLFNAGFVIGAGLGFSETRSRRYFYRYSSGYAFGTHSVGMRWLF